MHEAAIAKEVFDIAQQAMTENGLTRLTRIVMDIGEYSAVVPEQLQLVFRIAVHNTAMDGCALEIHDLPGELGMYVRTRRPPEADSAHVCRPSGIFSAAHVPEKMTGLSFAAPAAKGYEVFDKLTPAGTKSLRACFVGCSVP